LNHIKHSVVQYTPHVTHIPTVHAAHRCATLAHVPQLAPPHVHEAPRQFADGGCAPLCENTRGTFYVAQPNIVQLFGYRLNLDS
jgi:hypothetical protein